MTKINLKNNIFTVDGMESFELNARGENDAKGSFTAISIWGDEKNKTKIVAYTEKQEMLSDNPTKFRIILPKHLKNPVDAYFGHRQINRAEFGSTIEVICYASKIIFE